MRQEITSRRPRRRVVHALVCAAIVSWTSCPRAIAAAVPEIAASSPPAVALEALHFTVACVQLVDASRFPSIEGATALATPATQPALSCPTRNGPSKLVGKGQVIVLVDAANYASVVKAAIAANVVAPDRPELVLNGFHLGQGGRLIAVEKPASSVADPTPKFVALRYQLEPADDSEAAWSTLYQEVGLLRVADLRIALAWNGVTVFSANPDPASRHFQIAISDWLGLVSAFAICLVVLAFYWWAMYRTDLFRTATAFPWWDDAARLRAAVKGALRKDKDWQTIGFESAPRPRPRSRPQPTPVAPTLTDVVAMAPAGPAAPPPIPRVAAGALSPVDAALLHARLAKSDDVAGLVLCPTVLRLIQDSPYGGAGFSNDHVAACLALAKLAIAGNFPPRDDPSESLVIIGLALHRRIPVVRASFSLVAVQVGTWVTFACLAAIFLWLVFGQWPQLKGSMLVLVTISAMTASASWLVDTGEKTFIPSVNLLRDVTSGSDGEQRAHRFQAVMVNVLLLFIGTAYVVQRLAYPTFDSSWLEFLGLSGLLQTAGKSLLEKPQSGAGATGKPRAG